MLGGRELFLLRFGLKLSASSCAVDAAQLDARVQSCQMIIDYEMENKL